MPAAEVPLTLTTVPVTAHAQKFCDTLEIDQQAHRLYAGDNWSGGVDVFDLAADGARYVKTIRTRGGLYGIAVAPELHKVFVGLAAGVLGIIDVDPASAHADEFIARLDLGGRGAADLIDYDPRHRKIYVANRNDRFMTVIDATTNAILRRIDIEGGGLEQPRFNPADNMVYLSGNVDNVLYQVDAESDTLVRTIPLGEPCHPNGLAINPATQKAVLANSGRGNRCLVWDLANDRLDSVADTGGGDGAVYDPVADRFYFAASGFRDGPVIGVFDGTGAFLGNLPSAPMASWVAFDQANQTLYVPTVHEGRPALASLPKQDP